MVRRTGRGIGASILGAEAGRATAGGVSNSMLQQMVDMEISTSWPCPSATFVLLVHPLRHELLDSPLGIPLVVRLDETAGCFLVRGANLDLVVVG